LLHFEDGSIEAAPENPLHWWAINHCNVQIRQVLVGAFNQATATSFKRVVGMRSRQAKDLQASDPDFWNSLPFQTIILDGVRAHQDLSITQTLDMLGASKTKPSDLTPRDCVAIRIQPLPFNPLHGKLQNISQRDSSEVTTILLQSIPYQEQKYMPTVNSNKCNDHTMQNCIIIVPAHYSHAQ
jgi:hypothetical protein